MLTWPGADDQCCDKILLAVGIPLSMISMASRIPKEVSLWSVVICFLQMSKKKKTDLYKGG